MVNDELDDTAITVQAKYSANISESRKKICFSLNYNAANSFLYIDDMKIYQFEAKVSEIKSYPLSLGTY